MSAPARVLPSRISEIVGAANLITDEERLSSYEVDGLRPAAAARPGTTEEVAELVRFAAAEKLAAIPCGARTKMRIGMPPARYDLAMELTRLDRIPAYDPGDLTVSIEAGCPLAKLQSVLAEHKQFLPLITPFYSQATIGGALAANSGTPLRQMYGTPRDYVLGLEFITGEGVRTKSGGRVVKNVTGYDLHKLMIGAFGTLGVITRVNCKTFPLPRATRSFLASFAGPEDAFEMRRQIARSPIQPHTLEAIDPAAVRILKLGPWLSPSGWSLAAATDGHEPVLERHTAELKRMAEDSHATSFTVLELEEKTALWDCIREFPELVLESSPAATILKISAVPAQFDTVIREARKITDQNELASAVFVRAAGIIYLALVPDARDSETIRRLARTCTQIFEMTASAGARAAIEWCPTELKREVNVWGPTREDFPLMQKLKKVFDPHEVFSPGRFVGGL
jgi:glycolate oxidase FAD binding subunit